MKKFMKKLNWRFKLVTFFAVILVTLLLFQLFYIIPYIRNREVDLTKIHQEEIAENIAMNKILAKTKTLTWQLLIFNLLFFAIALIVPTIFARQIMAEQRCSEKELQEKEKFNFALFQYNFVETIIVSIEGRVIKSNLAKRLSGNKVPNVGDVMYRDYAGKHEIDMYAELMECISSGKVKEFPELKYDDRFLSITISPFPKGAIIISQDVTEQKHARNMLEKSTKLEKEQMKKLQTAYSEIKKNQNAAINLMDDLQEDIIKRKKTEKELRNSESFNFALFQYNPIETIVVDREGKIVKTNLAKRKSGSRLPNIGDVLYKDYAGKHTIDMHSELMECIHSGKTKEFPESQYNEKYLFIKIAPFPQGAIVTSIDITERKLLQEKLIQTEKLAAVGELISGVAHEINNPLTGVVGFSELLMQEAQGLNKEEKEELGMICSEAKRIQKIVSHLLSFSRKHKPKKEPLIINNVLEQVLKIRAYELNVNNINVIKDFDENIPFIQADNNQLTQVLLNIINNAQQAMNKSHKKGNLTVKTYIKNDMVITEFIDDGPGISEENISKIFNPFFTTKGVGEGTGLGLSVTYGIIKEHNGNISVKSDGIDKGAKFIIELPVAREEGRKG